jgi:hypothetical protein
VSPERVRGTTDLVQGAPQAHTLPAVRPANAVLVIHATTTKLPQGCWKQSRMHAHTVSHVHTPTTHPHGHRHCLPSSTRLTSAESLTHPPTHRSVHAGRARTVFGRCSQYEHNYQCHGGAISRGDFKSAAGLIAVTLHLIPPIAHHAAAVVSDVDA